MLNMYRAVNRNQIEFEVILPIPNFKTDEEITLLNLAYVKNLTD